MEIYYAPIRLLHITCVLASGSLVTLRGMLALAGRGGAGRMPLRYLSYAIDTTLLTAAFMLMTITHQYPFAQAWLTVKLLLVLLYIGLGLAALRPGGEPHRRALPFGAALLVFLAIVAIARSHDPLGFLHLP